MSLPKFPFIKHDDLGINLSHITTYMLEEDDDGCHLLIWTSDGDSPMILRGEAMEKVWLVLTASSLCLDKMSVEKIREYLRL